jgi:hypothetical protein
MANNNSQSVTQIPTITTEDVDAPSDIENKSIKTIDPLQPQTNSRQPSISTVSEPSNEKPNEKRPSIALRRLQQRSGLRLVRDVVQPPDMELPLRDGYRTPTVEDYERHFAKQQSQDESRRHSRFGSWDLGQMGFSYMDREALRAHLERPRTSIRETFERSQLHLQHMGEKLEEKLEWNERVRHYTWNFFSMTMATGGIANVLHTGERAEKFFCRTIILTILVPYRFQGLDDIGLIFFFFNLFLFTINVVFISIRFIKYPETLKASVTHPTESLFVPASVVSLGTVILNIAQYGLGNTGTWLDDTLRILFWFYAAIAIVASVSVYLLM